MSTRLTITLAVALVLSGGALAQDPDPRQRPDDSWITISGQVEAVTPDAFTLNYGEGTITVEMDDGDRDADGYKLLPGDKVTVTGKIDDDLFERTTIEASSVYVEKLGTYFYASAVDEEDLLLTVDIPVVVSATTLRGTVEEVRDEEFTLMTGGVLKPITVEVEEMPYNPLDDEGYQKIEPGNRVLVTGQIDDDLFEGRELVASSIVTLGGN